MSFAKEGWPFVIPFLLLALVAWGFDRPAWGLVALSAALFLLFFFRVPSISPPADPDLVLAAAHGKVLRVETITDPAVGPGEYRRIVTFLSVFDVHLQRCPIGGRVVHRAFESGAKRAAFDAEAEQNERELTVIDGGRGRVGVRQIVGLIARRIVCDLSVDDEVDRASRLGVIKFGSRVDLMVPAHYEILVNPGDRVRGGETPMARVREP